MNKAEERRYTQDQVDLALMATDLAAVKKTVESMNSKLDADYVTKDVMKLLELKVELLQKIVYGMVTLVLVAFVGAVINLVIKG